MKSARRGDQASPPSSKPAAVSFMPRSQRARVDTDSSQEDAAEGGFERGDEDVDDDDVPPLPTFSLPPASSQSVSTR